MGDIAPLRSVRREKEEEKEQGRQRGEEGVGLSRGEVMRMCAWRNSCTCIA